VEGFRILKKIAFLHGFLGAPTDMSPFFLDKAENTSVEYRELLLGSDPIGKLTEKIADFDVLVGYSFGGRLLGEVKKTSKLKNKTWVFVSSRHSPYTDEQLREREVFRDKLSYLIQTDLQKFNDYWNGLPLFSGHLMSDFREQNGKSYKPWTEEEKLNYLEKHFNSTQFFPEADKNVHYVCGEKDLKYSNEAKLLKKVFNVYTLKGVGHRAPFEDVNQFKNLLVKNCL